MRQLLLSWNMWWCGPAISMEASNPETVGGMPPKLPKKPTRMPTCIKCGGKNIEGAESCSQCRWPFSRRAWVTSDKKIQRITLDTGCINVKKQNADLNTLERWAAENRIVLERSAAMLQELKGNARIEKAQSLPGHPRIFNLGNALGDGVLAGPDIPKDLQKILFPTARPLTTKQRADIEHLRLHIRTGGDVFVTLNPRDFITRGRQAVFASFGVWVMAPKELVALLRDLNGWH